MPAYAVDTLFATSQLDDLLYQQTFLKLPAFTTLAGPWTVATSEKPMV